MNSTTSSAAKQLVADSQAPVCNLQVLQHFNKLSEKEKRYAHHMSRACHHGTRIVLRQVSAESEGIYDLILAIHGGGNGDWERFANAGGITVNDVELFLEYASQFLANLGNYKSFGDTKYVPRVSASAFGKLAAAVYASELFDRVKDAIYKTQPEHANMLGYPDCGYVTGYYSEDVTQAEIAAIQKITTKQGILPENSRVFKTGPGMFEFRIASALPTGQAGLYELENGLGQVKLVYGEHAKEMKEIVRELEQAREFAENKTQVQMLDAYIESFRTGSMDAHKESQKFWVKDLGPKVETNIGFIETYRDPSGVRGEWEGLVAMINKERTKKFESLVNNAKKYIDQLPWPREFEKDIFTAPDFTSLEVLTFAGSGIPAGINIPNYDDVRLTVGFKNVSLGNVLSAKGSNEKTTFLSQEDTEVYDKWHSEAFEMQVGIHEFLGHGTGKLLAQNSDGTFNFESPPVSPITGKPVTTFYKAGETWGSVFGAMAASYEECRAETVAMYLATDKSILEIFGHVDKEEADAVLYVAYLQMARAGLLALEFWDPTSKKWGQAHMQARYSILQAFLQAPPSPNGERFVELVHSKPDYSDLTLKLNKDLICSIGKDSMKEYLEKIHIYKCSADYASGKELYDRMTKVDETMQRYRDVVMARKLPRKQFVQANTFIQEGGNVELKEYEASVRGMIQSFSDRRV